jgi:hypothetical protein
MKGRELIQVSLKFFLSAETHLKNAYFLELLILFFDFMLLSFGVFVEPKIYSPNISESKKIIFMINS